MEPKEGPEGVANQKREAAIVSPKKGSLLDAAF